MKLALSLCAKFLALIIMYIGIGLMIVNQPIAIPCFVIGTIISFGLLLISGRNEVAN